MKHSILSYGDFYSLKKSVLSAYLYYMGFGCLGSLKRSKSDLVFDCIDIYKKFGSKNFSYITK